MAESKNGRAELIAALVTDKFSGFKDGDENMLEACSDTRLEEFRAASEARKNDAAAHVRLETDHRNTSARLKIAEDKVKASEQELSEEEFLAKAPSSIKSLIENHKAQEAELRADLVSALKDCGANTEDELKKMDTSTLRNLAKYARVNVPDFSGKGFPVQRDASEQRSYAAPKPYTLALEAAASGQKH